MIDIMLTDEQVLSIASDYLETRPNGEWISNPKNLLKFAEEIFDYGYSEGHGAGYKRCIEKLFSSP